ncbi:iditol 2-dehydrogenase [Achromobacter denitrificans]|uniref:Zinc-binding dehydrogenase n=1 Tax=Achromobacter denitrificans TaxID=32002 RepID=A0A6J5B6Q2_ACHDE|nr:MULTISPECIES: zinc-binding dehydrogenase [Achromobacter]ASC63732.1 iditol 2-dehydrogenase [Achromobacter denitrificans]MBV2160955.1 zinc-binding dehydrogenase [Achromobacter denitrificans]MDX3880741.1 zinc-binding dehydrogenase [Achromobacter sp.]OLU09897.1 iditol 2-dehydrogenase [Achromobacter denitrificans]QCS62024.1 zinc-binding dehydrogenase [Achromobacter denitrificans]
MRAVYFLGDRKVEIRDVPDPTPGPGEVIIEIKASGMCGTDLKYYRASDGASAIGFASASGAPVIAGHEPCGIVCEAGPGVTSPLARIGRRVMNHHYSGCGCCNPCRTGWTQMCDEGSITFGANGDGAHARYMKVPADSLVALPDELSFQAGAAISCGTGTAWGGLHRLGLRGEDTIAIFGQGPVGLSGTQLAVAMGARVIALDFDDSRLERAREFGADCVINARAEDPAAAIIEATGGRGAACAMDCTGSSAARSAAVRSAAKWGRVVFLGEGGNVTIDVSTEMNRKQLSIYGSWTFSRSGQADCARFVAERGIDVDRLFTHSWPLEQAEQAYGLFDTQTTGKGVLIPA